MTVTHACATLRWKVGAPEQESPTPVFYEAGSTVVLENPSSESELREIVFELRKKVRISLFLPAFSVDFPVDFGWFSSFLSGFSWISIGNERKHGSQGSTAGDKSAVAQAHKQSAVPS